MGFDPVSYILGRRAGAAAVDPLKSWAELQLWLRAGQLGQVLEPGDQLNVEVGGTARDFDVLGLDEDVPVNADLQHVLSIQAHGVLGTLPFDPPMYLFAVTAAACAAFGWPETGMPAGTYHVILDHGAADGGTGQDGNYQFTTTVPVPVGGGVRHSSMGTRESSQYTKSQITAGIFATYAADTVTTLETNLVCTEGNGGICLGTASSKSMYKVGDFINFTTRQKYGSNRWSTSYLRQMLNSEDAALRWTPGTIWSRNADSVPEGFLHSLEPALRAVLCAVRTRYALGELDGGSYEDITDHVKLPTLLDLSGSGTGGVLEGPVDAEGELTRSTAYAMWQELSTSADRVKYAGTSAKNWWTGSVGSSYLGQRVTVSGGINSTFPNSTNSGVAPCLFIG